MLRRRATGDLVVQRTSTGTVMVLKADDQIGISPGLLADLNPDVATIEWPLITFCGGVTYRVVDFDTVGRVFVARKDSTLSEADRFMAEHFDPRLVGPA